MQVAQNVLATFIKITKKVIQIIKSFTLVTIFVRGVMLKTVQKYISNCYHFIWSKLYEKLKTLNPFSRHWNFLESLKFRSSYDWKGFNMTLNLVQWLFVVPDFA